MNTKRNYPLFIIDDSRSHGRGTETDYISCTSKELPFVAQVTLHDASGYAELYSAEDYRTLWSDPRHGIRMRIQIISQLPSSADTSQVRSLLRRAMKEMQLRRQTQTVDVNDIKDVDVYRWASLFSDQVSEYLRKDPDDKQQKMNKAILNAIMQRFNDK